MVPQAPRWLLAATAAAATASSAAAGGFSRGELCAAEAAGLIALPEGRRCHRYDHRQHLLAKASTGDNRVAGSEFQNLAESPDDAVAGTDDKRVREVCGFESPLQLRPGSAIEVPEALKKGYKLRQVQAIVRHGAPVEVTGEECANLANVRWNCSVLNPQVAHFADPFNHLPGTCQMGQLLDVGYKQHLLNGKALRKTYVESGLLGVRPRVNRVYAYSDFGANQGNVRTAQSKHAFMTAMFEGSKNFHIEQSSDFNIFFASPMDAGSAPWAYHSKHEGVLKEVFDFDKTQNPYNVWPVPYYCMVQGVCNDVGSQVPVSQFLDVIAHDTKALHDFYTHTFANGTLTLASFQSAEFGLNILRRFQDAGLCDTADFVLWSTHDNNIYPTALMLGLELDAWVPFGAVLLVEVWKPRRGSGAEEDVVRVLYQGKDVTAQSKPCAGRSPCAFSTFTAYIEKQVSAVRDAGLGLVEPPPLDFCAMGLDLSMVEALVI